MSTDQRPPDRSVLLLACLVLCWQLVCWSPVCIVLAAECGR